MSFALVKAFPGSFGQEETQISKVFIDSHELKLSNAVRNYLTGNWGSSWNQPDKTVLDLISDAFIHTSGLILATFLLIVIFSFLLSFLGLQSEKWYKVIQRFTNIGVALPLLFLAPLAAYFLSVKLGWTPLRYDESLLSYVLPVTCLLLRPLCFSTQILSLRWRDSQYQDYFRMAQAKGLSRAQAFWRHGLKNSALSYLTQLTQILAQILTGSILIERLFSFPGLGTLFIESLHIRDLPVLLAVVFIYCLIYIFTQLSLEHLQRVLEPRSERGES